jgi:hypothetical protein
MKTRLSPKIGKQPQYVMHWPAAFARADALAREIIRRQVALLIRAEVICRIMGGSDETAEEAKDEEGQSELAERKT